MGGICGKINLYGKLCQEINWLCLEKGLYCGRVGEIAEKETEIDAEIQWDVIEKNGAVGYVPAAI